jgi:two-component system, NarL family, nitrate/nitrite response regulator NarL
MSDAPRGEPSLRVALVCRAQLLRLGLERVLGAAGHDVQSHDGLFAPPEPADVAVLCERELGDLEASCADAHGTLAWELVVVFRRPSPEAMLDCLTAGVRGFAAEHDTPADLIAAARAAARGEYHVSAGMLSLLLDWHRVQRLSRDERSRARDRDLLGLLAAGAHTNTIAERLGIAPKTVRNRSSLLYRRLGVHSRAEAARVAEERGLLD